MSDFTFPFSRTHHMDTLSFKSGWGGTCPVVQWFRLQATDAEGTGLIPYWGINIPHATWYTPKKRLGNVVLFFFFWVVTCLAKEISITKEEGESRELEGSMGLCHNNNDENNVQEDSVITFKNCTV